MTKAKVFYSEDISVEAKPILQRIEPIVLECLVSFFCLSCGALWTCSDLSGSEKVYTLWANTVDKKTKLGVFELSILKRAGKDELVECFQQELKQQKQQNKQA